jgi:2-keto-4-pentenoate hydratase
VEEQIVPYIRETIPADETIISSLTQVELKNYARQMLDDYDAKTPGKIFKDRIRLSSRNAYRIQSAVTDLRKKRGEEVIGFKIGCIAKATQEKMGLTQPAWGNLWKNELHSDGVVLKKTNFFNPAMEAEFGIILNRDIQPELVNFEYILSSIETIHPVIEIHNLIFYGNPPLGAELLANNAIHAGVVIGEPTKGQIKSKVTDLKLIFDQEVVDIWQDKRWPYDILSKVQWLVKEQQKLGNIVKKGNLILTGAYGFPIPINEKELIKASSSGFGNVSAIFA